MAPSPSHGRRLGLGRGSSVLSATGRASFLAMRGQTRGAMYHPDLLRHPDACPALVLNADYTPLSYYPLSLWPWQTAVKAVFLERVDIVAQYVREVHSPTRTLQLPSVIALRQYVKPSEHPAFTRFNLFLRDRFECQYCASPAEEQVEPGDRKSTRLN